MTPVLINNQEIGLVFKSGNVVHVDYWAIEELDFDVNGSAWVFDKSYKQIIQADADISEAISSSSQVERDKGEDVLDFQSSS